MSEVEILTGEDVLQTRLLWEEVFTEDTKSFVDYYYSHKAKKNICFVIREENDIVAMAHLTLYDICVTKEKNTDNGLKARELQACPTFYIVGVATRESYRHRGYMTALLERAFVYMKENDILFTFLMPAHPAIYEPFGFQYIYKRANYHFCPAYLDKDSNVQGVKLRKAEEKDCEMLASFAMEQLREGYEFFLKRDEAYFQTLLKELASENGCIYLIYVKEQFAGYFTYACEEEEFVQEVLVKKQYESILITQEEEPKNGLLIRDRKTKPIIMGKYLYSDTRCDLFLQEIAEGRKRNGFINEVV